MSSTCLETQQPGNPIYEQSHTRRVAYLGAGTLSDGVMVIFCRYCLNKAKFGSVELIFGKTEKKTISIRYQILRQNCIQRFRPGLHPRPRAYDALPDPLAKFKGTYF